MSVAFNKIKKVDRSKLEGNALKAYDSLKEETDNFDKDVAVALNLDDDVERLAKKLEEKFPESVGKKKAEKPKSKPKKKAAAKKKSTPKGGSGNKGSFAKLRASIAKRDGISYKAALPIAKKEYAEQKKKDSDSKKEKRSKRMEAFKRKYKGRGTRNTDVQKDSKIPAKAVGKRVSKTGNTYYEYRDNRTDQRQPQPTNEPRLDVGGMIKREYDVNINSGVGTYAKGGEVDYARGGTIYAIGDEVKDRRFGNDLGVIKGYNEESYFIKHQDGEDATGLMFWIGQEDEGDRGRYYNLSEIILSEDYDDYENDRYARYKVMVGEEQESDDLTKDDAEDLAYRLKRIGAKDVKVERMIYAKGGKTDETFIQDAVKEMEKKGTIGTFTKKAEKRGMTPVEFASEVLDSTNKNKFTEKTRKQAQFVKNANPELFAFGGEIVRDYDVNINSGVGTYAKGGKLSESEIKKVETAKKIAKGYVGNDFLDKEPSDRDVLKMIELKDKKANIDNEIADLRQQYGLKRFAKGGDILKAGDTDCPDELLNYAVGGRLNETMQGLKKGDTLKIKFGSAVSKDNVVTLRVRSRNKVRKGTIDKITFENLSNPKGVKFFAYDRGDGFSFAMGDLGISNVEILNKYKEGGKTQGYNAQLDESLGDRTGREDLFEQKKKDRRDESKAMEEAMNRRAYASVQQMDKKKRRK